MKWQKTTIPIILIMVIALMVFADEGGIETYKPNQVFDLSLHLTDSNGEVEGANCSIQIRNASYNVELDDDMREQSGGYYNYTYNTSKIGKYYCRQNCTKGVDYSASVCDFTIKGEENMYISLVLILIFTIIFLLWLAYYVNIQSFKFMFIGISILILMILISIGIIIARDNISAGVQDLISTIYSVLVTVFIFFGAIMAIMAGGMWIYNTFKNMRL